MSRPWRRSSESQHPPSRAWSRLRRALVLVLSTVVLILLGGALLDHWHRRAVDGPLVVEDTTPEPGRWTLGSFEVAWERRPARLVVTHQDTPERELWGSLPDRAFVAAAIGYERVRESRGLFDLEDRLERVCRRQRVDSIELSAADPPGLDLRGRLDCDGEPVPYGLRLEPRSTGRLAIEVEITPDDGRWNRVFLTWAAEPDEGFYGFGAQFSHFDLAGRLLPIVVSEQGIGRGAQPVTLGADLTAGAGGRWHHSYAPVPHFLTSALRSFALANNEASIFDLRDPRRIQVRLLSRHLRGSIYHGESPAELISEHSRRSGRMRPLPEWVHEGAIVGLQGGSERIRTEVARLEEHGVPIAALWLQDWVGQRTTSFGKQLWWSWQLDRAHYPEWDELLADLESRGIRVLTYVNPFLVDVSEREDAAERRDLLAEARNKGYLVRGEDGEPLMLRNTSFSAGLLDLTHPGARHWMRKLLRKEVLGAGASGWMADFGEALPWDAVLHDGRSAAEVHNEYPELWARLNREVVDASERSDELLFFSRAGYTGSPRYTTLFWLGDQMVSWDEHDGIKTAVTGLLSSGLSGMSLNHSDVGGYTTLTHPVLDVHRDHELLLRWIELNAFTAVFRSHEGNQPAANVQVTHDDTTLGHFARFARVYRAWGAYRRELVNEAAEHGLPVVRHPWIHYSDDPEVQRLSYQQFLVGEAMLVAPVLDPGRTQVEVYLPRGRWRHLWSGDLYDTHQSGRWIEVAAPLGEPGVFLLEGFDVAREFPAALRAEGIEVEG